MTDRYLGRMILPYLGFGELKNVAHQCEVEKSEFGVGSFGYARSGEHYLWDAERPLTRPDLADAAFNNSMSVHRGTNPDQAIANADFSVIVVGGSFAHGYGATRPETTWSAALERSLAQRLGKRVVCLTAAIPGFVSTQEVITYTFSVLPRRPSLALVVGGFNDLGMPLWYGCRPGDPYLISSFWKAWIGHPLQFTGAMGAQLDEIQAHLRTALTDARRRANLLESIADVYAHNVRTMLDLGRQFGVPTLVWFQPWRDRSAGLNGDLTGAGGFDALFRDAAFDAYERIALRVNSLPRYADLSTRPFSTGRFIDPCHLDDAGQAQFAEYALDQAAREAVIPTV